MDKDSDNRLVEKKRYFLKILSAAEKRYGKDAKRLASDNWPKDYQTLIATILSAQTRDETTIYVSESLFKRYDTLNKLSDARYADVLRIIKSVNFSKGKARHIIATAKILLKDYDGKVPSDIEELVKLPGVGRKTANLVIIMVHRRDGLAIDTHVHAICNLLGFVHTKNPSQTETELKRFVPRRYWARINRLFVLWGKKVPRKTKQKLLDELYNK